jgi:hypothetical protein
MIPKGFTNLPPRLNKQVQDVLRFVLAIPFVAAYVTV